MIERIGSGPISSVFKGFDTDAGRYVAVKYLNERFSQDGEARRLFVKTVAHSLKLQHANIVRALSSSDDDSGAYVVMEYVDGVDLQYFLSANVRFSQAQAVNLLHCICEGLDYAHGQGVLHLGIKPSNILISKTGVVKLSDFGMSAVSSALLGSTGELPREIMAYKSPEQRSDVEPDVRADIYSAALVTLEMQAGGLAVGGSFQDALSQRRRIEEALAQCPEPLASILAPALALAKQNRSRTVSMLLSSSRKACADYQHEELRFLNSEISPGNIPSLEEPYAARVIRKHLREGLLEAAECLLAKYVEEYPDHPSVPVLQAEMENCVRRRRCADLLKIGMEMTAKDDYDLALAAFNEVLQNDPDNIEAISGIQKIRHLQKDRVFRENIKPLLAQAAAHSEEGRFVDAIVTYRKVLQLDPDVMEVRRLIEDNEKKLSLEVLALSLHEQIRHALRVDDFAGAFGALLVLETQCPDDPELGNRFAQVWRQFLDSFASVAALPSRKSRPLEYERWFQQLGSTTSFSGVLNLPTRRNERNQFLLEARKLVGELLDKQFLVPSRIALAALNALFPGQAFFVEASEKVEQQLKAEAEAQERQQADAQRLETGIQRIRTLLAEENPESVHALWSELSKSYPADKALASLWKDVEALVRRAEEERQLYANIDRLKSILEAEDMEKARKLVEVVENTHPRSAQLQVMKNMLAERESIVSRAQVLRQFCDEAEQLRATGCLDEAMQLVRKTISAYPEANELYALLQRITNEKAASDAANEIAQGLGQVTALLEKRQLLKAGRLIFSLNQRFPDNAAAREGLRVYRDHRAEFVGNAVRSALAFSANRLFEDARRILHKAKEECPDALEIHDALHQIDVDELVSGRLAESRTLLDNQKFDLAIALLEECSSQHPEKAELAARLEESNRLRNTYIGQSVRSANALIKAGDPGKAATSLRSAAQNVPNSEEISLKLEEVERSMEEEGKRKKEEAAALRSMTRDVDKALTAARRLADRGNCIEALRLLENTRQKYPQSADSLEALYRHIQERMDQQAGSAPARRRSPVSFRLALPGRRVVYGVLAAAACVVMYLFIHAYFLVGTLRVDLGQGGRAVRILDRKTGKTVAEPDAADPLKISLPGGEYVLVYTLPEFPGAVLKEPVSVRNGSSTVLALSPLTVDLRPAGTVTGLVRLETKERMKPSEGAMPLRLNLPPGHYQVDFRITDIPGSAFSETVELLAGQPVEFSPALLTIDIRSGGRITGVVRKESGLPVKVAGQDLPVQLCLLPGVYTVIWEYSDEEGKPYREDVELKAGQRYTMVKSSDEANPNGLPEKNPFVMDSETAGSLVVNLLPWGKLIEIVNQETGERLAVTDGATPFSIALPPGSYRVVYTLADQPGKEFSEILLVKPRGRCVFKKVSPLLGARVEEEYRKLAE